MNPTFSRFRKINCGHPLNWLFIITFLGILFYLIWGDFHPEDSQSIHLSVYAFSTQEEVLTQGIFPAFEQDWEAATGMDVVIEGVFGPSGTLAGQIVLGTQADIAILSNQRHVDWLKFSKYVDKDSKQVLISSSPLVILTRPGNPKELSEFADLAKPGVQLLHANPASSGLGEWSLLAEFGSELLESGDPKLAESQLKNIWHNTRLVGSSARVTLELFELGTGDALVTYEQDALLAQDRGAPIEINLPKHTILTRHYAVIVDDNVTFVERPLAEAFLAFIQGEEGQQILSQYYFRSATGESDLLPALDQPFTEEDLGGWAQAYETIIENYWRTEIERGLELEFGTSFLVRGE